MSKSNPYANLHSKNKEKLEQEISRPTVTQVRQAQQWSEMSGLEPRRLARIIREADQLTGLPAYFTLLEELEERDGHMLAVIGVRKRAVCQMEITVESAEGNDQYQEHADAIEAFLARDDLDNILFDMLDAIGKGYSITEVTWDTSSGRWMPDGLIRKDQRFFAIDKEDNETLRLIRDNNTFEDLEPYKFIIHKAAAKSGSLIRGGVLRPCLSMYMFKNYQIKDWVIFNEAYNQPIRLGKYHAGASDDDKAVLLRAVHNIGSDAAAIIPENMSIEFIEAATKASTQGSYKDLINLCDLQTSKAVLGQTTTTDAISGGHSVAKEHNEVRKDISVSDAKLLASTLNRSIVKWIVDFNFGVQKKYPTISIGLSEEIDQEQFGKNAERAQSLGIPFSMKDARDKLGLKEPEDKADTIGDLITNSDENDDNQARTKTAQENEQIKATASQCNHCETAAQQQSSADKIDALSDDLADEFEDLINPVLTIVEQAADLSSNYEEFQQKLLELAEEADLTEMVKAISSHAFEARIAGNVEADI